MTTYTYLLHYGGGFTAETTDYPSIADTPAFMLGTPLVAIDIRDEKGRLTPVHPDYVRRLQQGRSVA